MDEEIVKPAAADGVPMEIKDKVNIKKLREKGRRHRGGVGPDRLDGV